MHQVYIQTDTVSWYRQELYQYRKMVNETPLYVLYRQQFDMK